MSNHPFFGLGPPINCYAYTNISMLVGKLVFLIKYVDVFIIALKIYLIRGLIGDMYFKVNNLT